MERTTQIINALLFIQGPAGLTPRQLSSVLEETIPATRQLLKQYAKKYNAIANGLQILVLNDTFKIFTDTTMKALISDFVTTNRQFKLSQAAIEAAAIIAYKQPITRSKISAIRGVASEGVVNTLLVKNLITEVGIAEAPGAPILYGITNRFYDYFKIQSLQELPHLSQFVDEEINEQEFDLYASQREN